MLVVEDYDHLSHPPIQPSVRPSDYLQVAENGSHAGRQEQLTMRRPGNYVTLMEEDETLTTQGAIAYGEAVTAFGFEDEQDEMM